MVIICYNKSYNSLKKNMPYFKVLGGHWGEGWQPGDIIELDTDAARVRLKIGDIKPTKSKPGGCPAQTYECCGSEARRHTKDCPTLAKKYVEATSPKDPTPELRGAKKLAKSTK